MAKQGEIRIGISGWRYAPWRESFYPKGLRQKDELAFAAGKFRTLEINGTFYGTQRPESFDTWRDTVPEDFVFAVKAPGSSPISGGCGTWRRRWPIFLPRVFYGSA